ncbi:MAG: glycosyltransferase [Ruegeria sp.]
MTVAFYAPMKSPNHPVPSGDRTMARALMSALRHAAFDVALASDLRIYDRAGDPAMQIDLTRRADAEVQRILAGTDARGWRLWVTYHNYYKAPDLIGPSVARRLGIPYIQIESTRAKKRLTGPWAKFARAAEDASDAAHTILYVTARDAETLERDAPTGQRLLHLPPFLDRDTLPTPSDHTGPMLSVGMMRPGDKLSSYALISETLAQLDPDLDWRLDIAGSGPTEADVIELMKPFGAKVRLLGTLDTAALERAYRSARLLFWPGVNEAFGYAYLEAQAAAVPVVAQDRPGMFEIMATVQSPVSAGPAAMAERLTCLLTQPDLHAQAARVARTFVEQRHLRPAAAAVLSEALAAAL